MGKKNKYLILLILGTAFWGISFPVTKTSVANNAPSVFLFYRFLFAAAAIGIIFYKQLKNAKTNSITAGIGLAIPLTFGIHFQTLGILKHPSASQCAFVAGMCVMVIPVLKTIFYNTAIEPKIWFSATLALVGLAIISITAQFSVNIGDVYVLTGTIGFSYYMIQVENFTKRNNITETLVPMFVTAALIMFIISLFSGSSEWLPKSNNFWTGVFYCSIFSTAFMYSVSNMSQKYITVEKVAIIYLFEPVFAAIASYFILDENLTWRLFTGGSLIIVATFISEANLKSFLSDKAL